MRRWENGHEDTVYDILCVIGSGAFHTVVSARKFAAEVCDGPAIAEILTYCDIDRIPMVKIQIFAAPKARRDKPLSSIRFRKDVIILSNTLNSKPTSFKIITDNAAGLGDEIFGSFPFNTCNPDKHFLLGVPTSTAR